MALVKLQSEGLTTKDEVEAVVFPVKP